MLESIEYDAAGVNIVCVPDRSRHTERDGKRFQEDVAKAAPILLDMESGVIY